MKTILESRGYLSDSFSIEIWREKSSNTMLLTSKWQEVQQRDSEIDF